MIECQYCNATLASTASLKHHQKTARYCLSKRGKSDEFECKYCTHVFSTNRRLISHQETCVKYQVYINTAELSRQIEQKDIYIIELKNQVRDLQDKLENIAIKVGSRPTTKNTTKNTQINNYIQKLECVTDEHIQNQVQHLTIEHIQKGVEGYAEYALEYPLKNRIVCVDYSRRKVKFKDAEGNVITDPEMSSLATKLFQSIKDRNKDLIMEYGRELRDRFGEEMDMVVKLLEYKSDVDNSAESMRTEFLHDFVRSVCGKTIVE